ncbi:MAG: dihydroorotase [Acutalibacteraceae bacterium]
MSLLLKEIHIISPQNGLDKVADILIENKKIKGIGTFDSETADKTLFCKGLYAFPGLVDMHVHLRDPGQTEKEDIISGCCAASAGGVTSLLCMPNTSPAIDNEKVVSYIKEKSKNAKSKVYIAGAITKDLGGKEITPIESLKKAGVIALSDDGRPVLSEEIMEEAMIKAKSLGISVVAHCEDLSLVRDGKINEGKVSKALNIKGIPYLAEDNGTKREISLARKNSVPVHICHVSTKTSVDLIRKAKAQGVMVTAETAPHYFSLTEDELFKLDADFRMNPPLRTEEDRKAIIKGIEDGTIDCIATDHAPHTLEEKQDFISAPNGSIGMETSFSVTLTNLYHTGILSLSKIAEIMSVNPAKILNINAGAIKEESPADILIADINKEWTVSKEKLHGKSQNTPFKNKKLKGKVICTLLDGEIVYTDESVSNL